MIKLAIRYCAFGAALLSASALDLDTTSVLQATTVRSETQPVLQASTWAEFSAGTAESASLSGVLPRDVPFHRHSDLGSGPATGHLHLEERQAPSVAELDDSALLPKIWACLGPVLGPELSMSPIAAFGDTREFLITGKSIMDAAMAASSAQYAALRVRANHTGLNHTESMKELARQNNSQPDKALQERLPVFPTEYGPGGHTMWAWAHTDPSGGKVSIDFAEAMVMAYSTDYGSKDMPYAGWAVGDLLLDKDMTLLVRCNEAFYFDDDLILRTPDIYEERRAVSVYHFHEGRHAMYVRFRQGSFTCSIYADTADGRSNVTRVPGQTEPAALVVLSDAMMADVVDGELASPYAAMPLLNAASFPVSLHEVEVVAGPDGLVAELLQGKQRASESAPIQPGQSFIVSVLLENATAPLQCQLDSENRTRLNVKLRVHPQTVEGRALPTLNVSLSSACIAERQAGFRVTFPDLDESVQHAWVAPPNLSSLQGGCPAEGCPVLLSLHGAAVTVSSNWGHNYALPEEKGSPFPYPAWLVEPSNRFHWGTDWEGPGYDDGWAALAFVREHLPGVSKADRSRSRLDPDRVLLTGHSMGGHGCLVFSVHDPDRLLASLCGACWTSQARYVRSGGGLLLDEASSGLLKARMAEHAADLLARNFRGVPLKIIYGEKDDNVPPREPRYMTRLVDSYSGSLTSVNMTELRGVGHWFTQNIPEVADFLKMYLIPKSDGHTTWPLPPLPEVFEFSVAGISSFGTKGNLKALQLAEAAHPGRFFVRRCRYRNAKNLNGACGEQPIYFSAGSELKPTAEVVDELWYIETTNLRRFRFSETPVRGRPIPESVVIDGSFFNVTEARAANQHFCMVRPVAQGQKPFWKLCRDNSWEQLQRGGPQRNDGPLHNVLRWSKVCIAHGGGASQAELALAVANKLYFVSRYAVPIVAAVSDNITIPTFCESDANWIFIGHPLDNRLLRFNKCAFPYITFHMLRSGGFSLDGVTYKGPGIGLIAMGRLADQHMALVILGTDTAGLANAGGMLPVTSFRDGADFLVTGRDAGWQGEGGVLAAGYLDHLWRPSVSSWAEPEHSVVGWQGISVEGAEADHSKACRAHQSQLLQSDEEISLAMYQVPLCTAAWLLPALVAFFLDL